MHLSHKKRENACLQKKCNANEQKQFLFINYLTQ